MGLYYESQQIVPVIGTKSSTNTRTSVALTNAYDNAATTKIVEVGGYSKVDFAILYTMGASETGNSIEVRVDQSPDGVNFYRIPNETVSGGSSVLSAREFSFVGTNGTTSTISIGLDIFYKYVRVSFKETGVASNAGSVFCEGTLSGK